MDLKYEFSKYLLNTDLLEKFRPHALQNELETRCLSFRRDDEQKYLKEEKTKSLYH
jgi:hypothetical protein